MVTVSARMASELTAFIEMLLAGPQPGAERVRLVRVLVGVRPPETNVSELHPGTQPTLIGTVSDSIVGGSFLVSTVRISPLS